MPRHFGIECGLDLTVALDACLALTNAVHDIRPVGQLLQARGEAERSHKYEGPMYVKKDGNDPTYVNG